MKFNYILTFLLAVLISYAGHAQDGRTFETKVADALNVLPANDFETLTKTVQELINLGPDVIDELVRLYRDSEGEQNVKMDYALSGIGKFLSAASPGVRSQFAERFVQLIQANPSSDVSTVLLEELALFLPTDQVSLVAPLVRERGLLMRTLDILEMHPSPQSGEIIWSAMSTADNRSRFKIYKILADPRFDQQDQVLAPNMANSSTELGQLILDGMASSGDPRFLEYFEGQLENDPDRITLDAMIKYGNALHSHQGQGEAVSYFNKLYNHENPTLKAMAIRELGRIAPAQAMDQLKSALTSEHEEVAVAATQALPYMDSGQYNELSGSIAQAPGIALANAIRILSREKWDGTEALIRTGLTSGDTLVSAQAVIGLAELNGTDAQEEVIQFLQSSHSSYVNKAGATALGMSTDKTNVNKVAAILPQVSEEIQLALVPLIADRGSEGNFDQILQLANQSTGDLQRAAISALPKLGRDTHITEVLNLLKSVPADQVPAAQSALNNMMSKSQSQAWEPNLLEAIEGSQNGRFIPLIGHLSGDKPRQLAQKILDAGVDSTTNQLLSTAGTWADAEMIDIVIPLIGNTATSTAALEASLGIIERSSWPAEHKILKLQKVYELSPYPHTKAQVVEKIGQHRNIYALLTVGELLDVPTNSIQNAAALAVMNIVMPGPQNDDGMTDSLAIAYLKQAQEVVRGPDSEYFKENINTYINSIPDDAPRGFVSMFDGKTLDGWHGFVANPLQLERMSDSEIEEKLKAANQRMLNHWWVEDGMIHFKGDGQNLVSDKEYGNFEMLVDWRIGDEGDSGIYLRGTPQVQIWDTSRTDVGAQVGSGGLYNNQTHPSKPLKVADMPIGDWNHMRIVMLDENVSVWLNGELVVDNVVMENYWDRSIPIFPTGPIELQAHGTDIAFRNIYVKEIPSAEDLLTEEEKREGFEPLFNGYNLDGWRGNKTQYQAIDGMIVVDPGASGRSGNLYTEKEYADFNFRFEFLLTPGANNGLGIRAPLTGDAAYGGVELQILDNTASIYANLKPYQYHGSLYGVAPAKRGYLKPVGEWNSQEVIIKGSRYKVILNGTTILDVDAKEAIKNGAMDGRDHPGLKNTKGHIGFLGHGSEVKFRNIRIKEL